MLMEMVGSVYVEKMQLVRRYRCIGLSIDGSEFARLDERGDGRKQS